MTNKSCIKCKESKNESSFRRERNTCNDCENKMRRDKLAEKRKNLKDEPKKCTLCSETKSALDFKVGCARCRVCEALKKKERLIKAKENLPENITCKNCDKSQSSSNYRLGEYVCSTCQREQLYKWRKDNPDNFKKICDNYRSKDDYRESQNKSKRNRYQNDPQENLRQNYRRYLRDYINVNRITKNIDIITGITRTNFRNWLEFNFKPEMTWDNYGTIWNLDHIQACSSFDLTEEDQLKKCFNWKNTVPVYCKENLEKFNKVDEKLVEYYKTRCDIFEDKITQRHIKTMKNDSSTKPSRKVIKIVKSS